MEGIRNLCDFRPEASAFQPDKYVKFIE